MSIDFMQLARGQQDSTIEYVERADGFVEPTKIRSVLSYVPPGTLSR